MRLVLSPRSCALTTIAWRRRRVFPRCPQTRRDHRRLHMSRDGLLPRNIPFLISIVSKCRCGWAAAALSAKAVQRTSAILHCTCGCRVFQPTPTPVPRCGVFAPLRSNAFTGAFRWWLRFRICFTHVFGVVPRRAHRQRCKFEDPHTCGKALFEDRDLPPALGSPLYNATVGAAYAVPRMPRDP